MTDIAIRAEGLSKLYHIGRARQRPDTLRDARPDGSPWPRVSIVTLSPARLHLAR